ncbi:MAG: hypothetical protein NXI04_03280 [Planctomycetaceae bacterium]|nr:hypothetical protein [Planctomycetaceae bacterium]
MRVLFHTTKSAPFFLALRVPSSRKLGELVELSPQTYELLFAKDDGEENMVRIAVGDLLQGVQNFLATATEDPKERSAKSVEIRNADGELIRGPAGGMTLRVGGEMVIARVDRGDAGIKMTIDGIDQWIPIMGDSHLVDRGTLFVNFTRAASCYDFCSRIEKALARLTRKYIWIVIEH